jgi:hypothetical protein
VLLSKDVHYVQQLVDVQKTHRGIAYCREKRKSISYEDENKKLKYYITCLNYVTS